MERFGETLRSEREQRGVTLDSICATTKVSLRHLESLEADDFEHLPRGVFRKGIVRSYIQAVGLDEAIWIERFEASLRRSGISNEIEAGDLTRFAHAVKRSRGSAPRSMRMRWLGVLLLILVLAGLAFLLWKYVLASRIHI
jgi:cytoskeleton protein RodZ